jgi:hypothetical protein
MRKPAYHEGMSTGQGRERTCPLGWVHRPVGQHRLRQHRLPDRQAEGTRGLGFWLPRRTGRSGARSTASRPTPIAANNRRSVRSCSGTSVALRDDRWPRPSREIRRSARQPPALGWVDSGFRSGCSGRGLRGPDLRCLESGTAGVRARSWVRGWGPPAGGTRRYGRRRPGLAVNRGAGIVAYPAGTVWCRKAASIADGSCGRSRFGRCPAQGGSASRAPGKRSRRRGRDHPEVRQVLGPDTTGPAARSRAGQRSISTARPVRARRAEPQRRAAALAVPAA